MHKATRRLLVLGATLPILLGGLAIGYMALMDGLEGMDRDFWHSLEWAAETLTTTGYGNDDEWNHPVVVLYVIFVQFIGVFLVFLIVPIYLIPFLEERFEAKVPRIAPPLEGHVVIFHYRPAVETLREQLVRGSVPYVVVETDEAVARRAIEQGVVAVYAPTEDAVFEAGRLAQARALVANGRDEENAAVILGARQDGFDGEIIALVEEPMHRRPLAMVGASGVFTPRHILAASLAARASDKISPRIAGLHQLGPISARELRIEEGSRLVGQTLREAKIGAKTGVNVIGQWVGGELVVPTRGAVLRPRTILVLIGTDDDLDRAEELFEGATAFRRQGPFVIAGFGEVGKKVHQLLTDVGEETWVIDLKAMPGVDVVGSVLDPEVFDRGRFEEARGVIVALDSDDLTLFTTVLAKEHAPSSPVIARVNQARHVNRMYRAGADFALSISEVSGEMLGRRLLDDESVALDVAFRLKKVGSASLVGRHPSQLAIRERTGATVVAVSRRDEVITRLSSDFAFEEGDEVFISGSGAAVDDFVRVFPSD